MSGRNGVAALFVLTAVLIQLTVVSRLGLPHGPANLALVTVACVALLQGPGAGMVAGFVTGLVGDLLSAHALGRLALVWTVLGYLIGLLAGEGVRDERNPLVPIGVVAGGCVLSPLAYALCAVALGEARPPVAQVLEQSLATGAYAVVLTPFVYAAMRGVLSRLDPMRS